jgi:hypothetical protein
MMKPPERTKWIGFLRLRDALAEPGCAICRIVLEASERMLAGLFHEFVNDPTTRAWLQAAGGFCNLHAWMAIQMPGTESGLGTIYETILDSLLIRFDECRSAIENRAESGGLMKLRRNFRNNVPRLSQRTGQCQICVRAGEAEGTTLHELLTWFDDDELRAAFDQSFGLCVLHLDLAISRFAEHQNLLPLIEAERQKCERLRAELKEFLRKLDYRHSGEPRGDEQDSWRRAVELLAGKARVFDSQLRRG